MECSNCPLDVPSPNAAKGKHDTLNKRWRNEFYNYLIPLLVNQANKGLKCDKSFKRVAFVHVASAVNAKFGTHFTLENGENHYRTLKAWYIEIKKVIELSRASWDDDKKMIMLDPIIVYTYTEVVFGTLFVFLFFMLIICLIKLVVHFFPNASPTKPFISNPIKNYEGLKIICQDDNAIGVICEIALFRFWRKIWNWGQWNWELRITKITCKQWGGWRWELWPSCA